MHLGEYFSTERVLDFGFTLLKIVFIIVASQIVLRLGYFFVNRIFTDARIKGMEYSPKRVQTLRSLAMSVLRYTIYFLAGTMILEEFNFPVTSILAGAGIVGLAVGFGAQNLVRDVISGFFILLENQYSVGEHVKIGEIEGIVEEMGLRITRIKDFAGQVHIIPNGEINIVTNFSSTESIRVMFDVSVRYSENVDKAIKVLERVSAEFAKQNEKVLEGPKVLGVQSLGEYAVKLRVFARALPMEQWTVERELKKKIKQAFDDEGFEFPFPIQTVVLNSVREQL